MIGQSAETFWDQTRRSIAIALKAYEQRSERDLQLALYAAWHTARLTNFSGARLPQLPREMEKFATLKPKPKRRQSREEMIAAMRQIRERTVH